MVSEGSLYSSRGDTEGGEQRGDRTGIFIRSPQKLNPERTFPPRFPSRADGVGRLADRRVFSEGGRPCQTNSCLTLIAPDTFKCGLLGADVNTVAGLLLRDSRARPQCIRHQDMFSDR